MPLRLATVYVKTRLSVTEAELHDFIGDLLCGQVLSHVQVLENGTRQLVCRENGQDEISFIFERVAETYIFEGACPITGPIMTQLMRKAVAAYKGDAIVNRLYPGYTIVYHYEQGSVAKILEVKGDRERLIYLHRKILKQLEQPFLKQDVEHKIKAVQSEIDRLLDQRNGTAEKDFLQIIDERLAKLSHDLFMLEA